MPWYVVKNSSECPAGKPFAVKAKKDGKLKGCHESLMSANQQVKALYTNVPDASK